MKEWISELRYSIEDSLRRFCGEITPEKRLIGILTIILIAGVANIYLLVKSIYNIGKDDAKKELIEIRHIQAIDLGLNKNDSVDNQSLNFEYEEEAEEK